MTKPNISRQDASQLIYQAYPDFFTDKV